MVNRMGDITEHFSWHEFACHDEAKTPVPEEFRHDTIRLCEDLEIFRSECNKRFAHDDKQLSLKVTSGYRTPEHNAAVSKMSNQKGSTHCMGQAADVIARLSDGTIVDGDRLAALAMELWDNDVFKHINGVGRYPNRVHLDVRKKLSYWACAE